MNRTRAALAPLLMALTLLVPALASAQLVDGEPIPTGHKGYGPVGGVTESNVAKRQIYSDQGAGHVLDRSVYQANGLFLVTALGLGSNVANTNNPLTGLGLTPYPMSIEHGVKWARILVTGAPTNSPPWSIRFYGTRDGTAYAPLLRAPPSTPVDGTSVWFGLSTLDTLKFRGRGPMTGNGVWFQLPPSDGQIPHKYIAAVCSTDSTVNTNYVFTVEIAGREK